MLPTILFWLLIVAFVIAGLVNVISTESTRRDFVKWGYPAWWGRLTGALELFTALLIALSATHLIGLVLAALILVAAIFTVLRHRDFLHLVPLGVFAVLVALNVF